MATSAWWVAVAMAVATVIGLAYYLAFAARLFRRPKGEVAAVPAARSAQLAVGLALVATVVLSVAPSLALGLASRL